MNRHSESSTIQYYEDHADEYVNATAGVNMESLYQPFLECIPQGGMILDAGCGSGRDTKAFLDRGYRVMAIDASAKMTEATTRLTRQPAQQLELQQLDSTGKFDGIWACATVLHIPLSELDDVVVRLIAALRPGGICYLSFKEGVGERMEGERLFVDFTEDGLRKQLDRHSSFDTVQIWITTDLRLDCDERWVNALIRKVDR